ncbi:MAG: hypothetical protein JW888_10715, partial [Pirellulales bacterium]|nr:hypothetical protein [Pirellulales bacterium]
MTEETRAEATLATEQPEPAPVDQPAEKVDADRAVPAPAKPLNKDHGSSPKDDDSQPQTSEPKRLRFNFRYQPWADVLDWFADQAGYSLVLDNPPKGTFNYRDDRAYTPAEAIDLLNSVLLTKGYTLVIRDRMLLVVNLEDEIPPALVAQVPAEQLDQRGKYELVSTRFQLKNLAAEEAQKEIEKLLGPQGQIVVLPKARQLVVMETGGRLREIRDVLERADRARDPAEQVVRWFDLTSVSPDEAVAMLRQIFEIPEDANATPDGSLHLATDPIGLRLLASGTAQRIEQVSKILATIDQSAFGESVETGRQAPLQLEVYDVAPADPESVLRVMQTLLADIPGTRLATDPKTGNLIAFARPTEQATVRATIDQLRHDAQSVEVIQLRVLDPQLAVLAIGKLFGKDSDKAPSIDADVANRQLLIRGSAGQIAQIRILLEKMGETSGAEATLARGRLRLVPLGGDEAQELIDRLQAVWPAVGSNELRIVPTREPKGQGGSRPRGTRRGRVDERTPVPGSASPSDSPDASSRQPATTQRPKPVPTLKGRKVRAMFAAIQTAADEDTPDPSSREDANNAAKPPILVLPTPNGLYVSSEDVQA